MYHRKVRWNKNGEKKEGKNRNKCKPSFLQIPACTIVGGSCQGILYGSSNVSSVHETPSPNSSGLLLTPTTDRHPFIDCLTHRVCREAETNLRKSKIALELFSNGRGAGDRSTKMFLENVGPVLATQVIGRWIWGRVSPAGARKQEWLGLEFSVRPGVSLADVCEGPCVSGGSGEHPGYHVSLGSSGTHMSLGHGSCGSWHMTGGSRCYTYYTQSWPGPRTASCRNMSPGPTSRHLGRQKRLHTEQSPWSTEKPLSKEYIQQYESLPESTMMSSSSPDPSSSRNTTCFPWRNTVLFPENPSTFSTFTTPSCRSWPSQLVRSALGSCLQWEGLGRRCGWGGWRGMVMSSSGSSLIVRPPRERGLGSSETVEWACCVTLGSPIWFSLSFLLFFFFSFSVFLRSSACRVVIVCCRRADTQVCCQKACHNCVWSVFRVKSLTLLML